MELAQKAMIARDKSLFEDSANLARQAMELEAAAADLIALEEDSEPTRSVLYRSAASLAYQAKDFKEAQRLVAKGLAGFPPPEVEEELKNLYEDVNFEYHLQVRGEVLAPEDFQMSLQGDAVGAGTVFYYEFKRRLENTKILIDRTIERLMGRDYRGGGKTSNEFQPFIPALSIPRAGSFAISFKLVSPLDQQLALFVKPKDVIDELIKDINLLNEGDIDGLKTQIGNPQYFSNFFAVARDMAPDGKKINFVGFTGVSGSASLTKSRREITRITSDLPQEIPTRKREKFHVKGILDHAMARGKNIFELTTEDNRQFKVHLDESLEDLVRTYFGETVIVSGTYDGDVVYLSDIQPDE